MKKRLVIIIIVKLKTGHKDLLDQKISELNYVMKERVKNFQNWEKENLSKNFLKIKEDKKENPTLKYI